MTIVGIEIPIEEYDLLLNMFHLLLIGGILSIVFRKLNMPAVIGYIFAGIVLQNYWTKFDDITTLIISFLADLGLIFMMFGIGMELNLKKLRKSGSFAIMVVMIQMPIMLFGGYFFGMMLGLDAVPALIFGAIISGSSTAVVTIVLKDQDGLTPAEVETVVLVTVIEDVAQVIIMSAVSPMMTGSESDLISIVLMFVKIVIFMVAAMSIGLAFVPRFLNWVGERMPDEVMLIISLGLCFIMAFLANLVGLSVAIGAFLMGVIVSQAKPSKIIEHDIRPMKDVFMMMFFISIGTKIVPMTLVQNIILVIAIYAVYFILKSTSILVAYFVGNKPMRMSFYSSISLVAMGEFAFIISKEALENNMISDAWYSAIIGTALVSMVVLPFINKKADRVCDTFQNRSPQVFVNGFMRLERVRTNFYARLSFVSKSTMQNFRTRLAYVYLLLIAMIIIEIEFAIGSTNLVDYIMKISPNLISVNLARLVVMLLNFVVLLPILFRIFYNIKFIDRVLLDSERKALEAGEVRSRRLVTKIYKLIIKLNMRVLVVLTDFIILLLVPNSVDFLSHLIVFVLGVSILALVSVVKYLRRS